MDSVCRVEGKTGLVQRVPDTEASINRDGGREERRECIGLLVICWRVTFKNRKKKKTLGA